MVTPVGTVLSYAEAVSPESPTDTIQDAQRLRRMVDHHVDFVWRSVRRLGVAEADADDATQQVLMVIARKLSKIDPALERSFVYGVAVRVAKDFRRKEKRDPRSEVGVTEAEVMGDTGADPEDLVTQKRQREVLDRMLDALPFALREVLVLYELEGMTTSEIAEFLCMPVGTAATRLRKARVLFQAAVKRLTSSRTFAGGAS